MKVPHHSPSSLNLFAASPAMYTLEKIIGVRQPVGAPAHRGTAIEAGVTMGLMDPSADVATCVDAALQKYDVITALSADARRADYRETIPAMVKTGLEELRPYGVPTATQGKIVWHPEELVSPILGYFDFEFGQHGIITDLKTSEKLPSAVKVPHARQISFYSGDNTDARATYITPKKHVTYKIDNVREHRLALVQMAKRVEKFLSLGDDPDFFIGITVPDLESYFWSGPAARQLAFQYWGV